jgi:hypothetical protein
MNIIKQQSLSAVVMPLVRVMADADLLWVERERVSRAIQACVLQWARMEKEREMLNNQEVATGVSSYYEVQNGPSSGPTEASNYNPNTF